MTPKTKAILTLSLIGALVVFLFAYKKVIVSFVTTMAFGTFLLLILYVVFRVWLWRRKRRKRRRRDRKGRRDL